MKSFLGGSGAGSGSGSTWLYGGRGPPKSGKKPTVRGSRRREGAAPFSSAHSQRLTSGSRAQVLPNGPLRYQSKQRARPPPAFSVERRLGLTFEDPPIPSRAPIQWGRSLLLPGGAELSQEMDRYHRPMVGAAAGQWEREMGRPGVERGSPQEGAGPGGKTRRRRGWRGAGRWLAGQPQPRR